MITPEKIVRDLYASLLGREPDGGGLETYSRQLQAEGSIANIVRAMLASEEFAGQYIIQIKD